MLILSNGWQNMQVPSCNKNMNLTAHPYRINHLSATHVCYSTMWKATHNTALWHISCYTTFSIKFHIASGTKFSLICLLCARVLKFCKKVWPNITDFWVCYYFWVYMLHRLTRMCASLGLSMKFKTIFMNNLILWCLTVACGIKL